VPGVFEEAFRTFRFRIERAAGCLFCRSPEPLMGDLDAALDDAMARINKGS
jgi:hypothetical protein